MPKQTKEEKLAKKREWYHKNIEKSKAIAKKSREKHKERRALDTKIWLEKNKEHSKEYHKQYHKKWYEENREKRSEELKEYGKLHKKENVLRTQKYTKKNKSKVYEYGKEYNKTISGSYRMYKSSSVPRKKEFNLSIDEFSKLVSSPCRYCGETSKKIGVDRVDNSIGYTLENCAPCCTVCNMMKKAMGVDDFLKHIIKIHNHNLNY